MVPVLVNTDLIYKIHMEDREDLVEYTGVFLLKYFEEQISLNSMFKSHCPATQRNKSWPQISGKDCEKAEA